MKAGFGWNIGKGTNILLWFDVWLGHDPLCLAIDNIDPQELCWTVQHIRDDSRQWQLQHLNTVFP